MRTIINNMVEAQEWNIRHQKQIVEKCIDLFQFI